ncbi:MAG: diphthine--ammonia ligase [Bacteroidia bacterium]|nr:diphthine--ammonia ligase [Bacteroidia bacterium]
MIQSFFNWSGGKDSSFTLYKVLQADKFEVKALLTNISEEYERISMHGVRKELLVAQAQQLNIPLHTLSLPKGIDMEAYGKLVNNKIAEFKRAGIDTAIFGDIFLEDLRKYREDQLAKVGIKAVFPIWKKDTRELVQEFIELGFKAYVVCCNARLMGKEFVGCLIDEDFLANLPKEVDPCGENGEFHSYVFDGPIFQEEIKVKVGEKILRSYQKEEEETNWDSEYWYCDLLAE